MENVRRQRNNLLHRLIISVTEMIKQIKSRNINYYKSVFVIIKYEDKNVFMGDLNFEGLV